MTSQTVHTGSCFCGTVRFELSGEPAVMAYCHCDSCRRWSASAMTAFTLWPRVSFKLVAGEDQLVRYNHTPHTQRCSCKHCGGGVFSDHTDMDMIDVPAVLISDFKFTPLFHVHYQERLLSIKDGLPKFKDLPAEAGGSGATLDE